MMSHALRSRDRKQTELELQNARRKETREMARDLESQLAAVERIAQVRHGVFPQTYCHTRIRTCCKT